MRCFVTYSNTKKVDSLEYPKVYIKPLVPNKIIKRALLPIARDGASLYEVILSHQNTLKVLRNLDADYIDKEIIDVSEHYIDKSTLSEGQKERLRKIFA